MRARGGLIRVYDIGGTTATKLRGVWRAIQGVLSKALEHDRAYLSVPGKVGVWLLVPLALALRLRGIVHFVHHHSFRPINLAPLRGMGMLVWAGGRHQRHILLSADMRRRFTDIYLAGDDDRAATLSNAYLFGPTLPRPPLAAAASRPDRPVTLGHMSVLTYEKGVEYLLDLFAILAGRGHDWRLIIAGPCADPTLSRTLTEAVVAHRGRVDYRGAVSGRKKELFFADIDLFVLPTTLVDEAEPLVMLEAFSRGVDVVANDTGCIRDRIRTSRHLMSLDRNADTALIEARVADCARDWATTRYACVEHAYAIKSLADAEAKEVFNHILNSGAYLPSMPHL